MDADWFTSLEGMREDGESQRSDNFITIIYVFVVSCKCYVLLQFCFLFFYICLNCLHMYKCLFSIN